MWTIAPASAPGFWGVPTSSVDWCEANYAHSRYVCELFNTLSSFALIAVGLVGAYFHRRVLEARFLWVFLSIALVGLGSVAFHGTLLFQLQMLDELPMLYTASLLVYILLEDRATRRFGWWLPAVLIGYAAVASYGAAFLRGGAQFYTFQTSFAAIEFYGLYRTWLLYRKSQSEPQRRLFRTGIGLYVFGIALWFIDVRFCNGLTTMVGALGLPNPQLHALWHVSVSGGLYCLILVIGYHRSDVLGRHPEVVREGLLPRLSTTRLQDC